ncbi:hypothetical protein HOLDEFILI_00960 [Holdemania filiformis DSM 12042]|uniref:Uncharacterized protein n=1 Tax=Holdemania filiformis DSM 12042 TaxID=545696 RepID=B9Y578_9FIRM|nr:hypothetical protein HOLDEFILI_00960 [Holdemania filiformis DSM 12042]
MKLIKQQNIFFEFIWNVSHETFKIFSLRLMKSLCQKSQAVTCGLSKD